MSKRFFFISLICSAFMVALSIGIVILNDFREQSGFGRPMFDMTLEILAILLFLFGLLIGLAALILWTLTIIEQSFDQDPKR